MCVCTKIQQIDAWKNTLESQITYYSDDGGGSKHLCIQAQTMAWKEVIQIYFFIDCGGKKARNAMRHIRQSTFAWLVCAYDFCVFPCVYYVLINGWHLPPRKKE